MADERAIEAAAQAILFKYKTCDAASFPLEAARAALAAAQGEPSEDALRGRIAALIEIVRDSPCPYDGIATGTTVANCQQCGCSHGLMIQPFPTKAEASAIAAAQGEDDPFTLGKIVGKAIGWDAAKRDSSALLEKLALPSGKATP